jgi:hypothetical protein
MLVALVIAMWAMQVKNKTRTMLLIAVACVFNSVSVGLLLNWVVFSFLAITAVRMFIFAFLENKKSSGGEIGRGLYPSLMLFFVVATFVVNAFTFEWWFDWVMCTLSAGAIVGSYLKGIHKMRLTIMAYDTLVIVNHVVFFNVVGIIMQVLLVGSAVVFYVRWFANKRKVAENANG